VGKRSGSTRVRPWTPRGRRSCRRPVGCCSRTLAAADLSDQVTIWDITDRIAPRRRGSPLPGQDGTWDALAPRKGTR
jgi:hypothetical protein